MTLRKAIAFIALLTTLIVSGVLGYQRHLYYSQPNFHLGTNRNRILFESESYSNDLNITSGSALVINGGVASTLTGETTSDDPWYIYNPNNVDQVKIQFPQMVFRAITPQRSTNWSNYQVNLSITPTRNIISDSPEVDGTDGIYLFMNYQDKDNLYVAGLTKDGRIIIKRKSDSYYGLIAEEYIFDGDYSPNDNLIDPFVGSTINLTGLAYETRFGDLRVTILVSILDQNGNVVFSSELSGLDTGRIISQGSTQIPLGPANYSGRAGFRLDSIEAQILDFSVDPLE